MPLLLTPGLALALLLQGFTLAERFEAVQVGPVFNIPTGLHFLPDGSFLLMERRGAVYFHDGTSFQQAPFIDLRDEINSNGDRGLLGITTYPGFVPDGGPTSWVYLLYTVSPILGADTTYNENDQYSFSRLTRYRAVIADGQMVADLASRDVLLGHQQEDGVVPDCIASLHNSHSNGSLLFGTDGTLLVATGDGAHWDVTDPGGLDVAGFEDFVHPETGLHGPTPQEQDSGAFRSQDLRSLAGKILRLDPDTGEGLPTNPFFDGDPQSNASRVWALGLRNPFRLTPWPGTGSTQPGSASPGVLFLGDVGWTTWEELDRCKGGENFGWPCIEGPLPEPEYQAFDAPPSPYHYPDCETPAFGSPTSPILAWHHTQPDVVTPNVPHFDADGSPLGGFTGVCAIVGAIYSAEHYPIEYKGRLFFFDFSGWLKTMELSEVGDPVAVHDFGSGMRGVDMQVHPLTGNLYFTTVPETGLGHVYELRYVNNLTPVAVASARPTFGDAPLEVQFDGSRSSDPDEDFLRFAWNFGDGSPPVVGENPTHVYTELGFHEAVLTVSDPHGASSTDSVLIAVGNTPPTATLLTPTQGQTFEEGEELLLSGTGSDFEDPPEALEYHWTVDLFHDSHVHPTVFERVFQSGDPTTTFVVEGHGDENDLYYYRISLEVRDTEGLADVKHVFVLPGGAIVDATGTALPRSRIDELVPPVPTGNGNPDIEVIRDGVFPEVGVDRLELQFDTSHGGDQGDDDWVGYELAAPLADSERFVALVFQEGVHGDDGGWWRDFGVEVRSGAVWQPAEALAVEPPYPFELADQPGFDGSSFETYTLRFDPVHGDAIRLRGAPGGSGSYVSVGELRVLKIAAEAEPGPVVDVTELGTVVGRIFQLVPPTPLGSGNPDPWTIHNGTFPQQGSASAHGQLDTFHDGDQGGEDWIGYRFEDPWRFRRVQFQEGLHGPDGGRFESLSVQVHDGGGWRDVENLVSTPAYPGDPSFDATYELFELEFDPATGDGIRIFGAPAGEGAFVSVGELRVFATPAPCPAVLAFTSACSPAGSTEQVSILTPLGCSSVATDDFGARVDAGPPNTIGAVVYGSQVVSPAFANGELCVGGLTGVARGLRTNAVGSGTVDVPLGSASSLGSAILPGSTWHFQALYRDTRVPGSLGTSTAITVTFAP